MGQELANLETRAERCMVDTDNALFQAKKFVENRMTLPGGLFGELELHLRQTKTEVDDLEFRLDEMGVVCGGASQALAYKQRVERLNQQLIGAMDSIQDFKDGQIMSVKAIIKSSPMATPS